MRFSVLACLLLLRRESGKTSHEAILRKFPHQISCTIDDPPSYD